jgi:hypothetical protein
VPRAAFFNSFVGSVLNPKLVPSISQLDVETERWIVGIVTNHAEKSAARKL